ncbi:hypothetical protein K438DRAFT_1938236 [Mycena galopus ATCC 62051]|nr:hypothetical protein K438DRAFT_1938236 [Mycena galopus ATCC 62051]
MLCRRALISLGILQFWSNWIAPALAQQTFFPSAVPLAVRTPTFNCWLDTRNGMNPMATWPKFWNDAHTLGWAGYIKVDGQTYHWLGAPVPGNASTWIATQVTPTRTIFTVQAGPMRLNVTLLSPIEPTDYVLQSFPFSYVYLDGTSTDGQSHSVQLYSDISAEWVTNSLTTSIQWSTTNASNVVYHQVGSTTPSSTFQDVAEDSVAFHAISSSQSNLVSVIGTDQTLRAQFATPGAGFKLTSDLPGSTGNVQGSDGKFPVFAHAMDFGQTSNISSVAWAVGVLRDPILSFQGVQRRAYYWSQFSTIEAAISAFIADFPAAQTRALALDQRILADAGAVSPEYADLISLGTRQAMAGMEITLSNAADGSFNLSDVKAFMKDTGNSQRVNPTEVIYAALPTFMYLNPNITGVLLEPLLEYQNSSAYTNPFAAPDLGSPYPQVPGNPSGLNNVYGIEDSGNMLILALAHARSSGDGSLIGRYYNLLKRWADYLTSNALFPGDQTSADARDPSLSQTHPNVTNLALKGIIAVQAMAEISQIVGQAADAQKYATNATSLMQSWVSLTSDNGQLRWTYDETTFGLMYNLLADKLLKLNLVPSSIYTDESTTLSSNSASVPNFGFPLSSDNGSSARSDWSLFTAAAAPDNTTRNLIISAVHTHASSNLTGGPFSNLYDVQPGVGPGTPNGFGSPAQGAMFAVLALNVANQTVVVPPNPNLSGQSSDSGGSSAKSHTSPIVGGIIAGLFALCLVVGVVILLRRRRRRWQGTDDLNAPRPYEGNMPDMTTTPFSGPFVAPISQTSESPVSPPSRRFSFVSPKAALMNRGRMAPEPLSPTSTSSPSQPSSSYQPPSSGAGSSVSRRTDDLRSEMQRLRQEVEELRATQGVPQEAPPGYQ